MKKIVFIFALVALTLSCENKLDVPLAVLTTDQVAGQAEVLESYVVAAYAILDDPGGDRRWQTSPSNWTYGSVASDNAYKGSDPGDQELITQMENYNTISTNIYFNNKWRQLYDGIARANLAINLVNQGVESGDLDAADATPIIAELRFLRGHYHFEAKKIFNKVPYIDETVTESIPNDSDIWPNIEADFEFASDNLSVTPKNTGRATSWTAKAYLAKTHMYQLDYPAAKPILTDIIERGPYSLNSNFSDNFNGAMNNSAESIFAVQYAINDGAGAGQGNGNYGDVLNYPHTDSNPFGCCGFHQPSHDLVNAFLVDETTGLPFVDNPITDPADYVKNNDANDLVGGAPRNADDDSFVPETRPLDPRLDHTVGRKGIDYKGWGAFGGNSWIRDAANGGPYMAKKHLWDNEQDGSSGTKGNWGQNVSTVNTNIIRYAEILLWRAEIAVSEADLPGAVMWVDMVRARAANAADFVTASDGSPAANYQVGLYVDNGGFPDADFAEKAIMYEHRLELALEGHRFFDLVRRGKADEVLNAYLARPQFRDYLTGSFDVGSDSYYPIPQNVIDLSGGVITP